MHTDDPCVTLSHKTRRLLILLGDTKEDIASRLAQEECYGLMGESRACPLACYLHKHLLKAGQVSISGYLAHLDDRDGNISVSLPSPVAAFVRAFDRGSYPFLRVCRKGYEI
jgi:hypothetical protein